MRARVGPFDRQTLTYPWAHADPRVDALQASVMRAGRRTAHGVSGARSSTRCRALADGRAGAPAGSAAAAVVRAPRDSLPQRARYC